MDRRTIIGAIHLVLVLIASFFFLIPKSNLDFLFLICQYTVFWSWTMFSGQCAISYFVKPRNDSSIDSNDIISLFGPKFAKVINNGLKFFTLGLNSLSIVMVLLRNGMNVWVGVLPLLTYYLLAYLKNPTIHLVFWFIFPFYIINCIRLYLKSPSIKWTK